MLKELRAKHKNVLLLDCGDSFSAGKDYPELRAEISMKALSLMEYDGLNIADGELGLGVKFFNKVKEKADFPLLSANLYKKKKPLGQPYVVKKVSGITVGIVGIVSPSYFNRELLAKDDMEIKSPEATIKEILPEVKSRASIIVLLSHLNKTETTILMHKVPGIDVAIVGHGPGALNQPEMVAQTIMVQNCAQGKFLGVLNLTVGEKGQIKSYQGSLEGITETTPSDPEVFALIQEFEKKRNRDRKPGEGPYPGNVAL